MNGWWIGLALLGLACVETTTNEEAGVGESSQVLGVDSEVEIELRAGGEKRFPLPLESGHRVRIEVEQKGVDVAIALLAPDGTLMIRVDSPIGRQGVESLFAVSETTGTHVVVVEAVERGAPDGGVHLRVRDVAPKGDDDQAWANAEKAFSQAENLRREEDGDAVAAYDRAETAFTALGARSRLGDVSVRRAWVFQDREDHEQAWGALEAAQEHYERAEDAAGLSIALNGLGRQLGALGRFDDAIGVYRRSIAVARGDGFVHGEAAAWNNLGVIHRRRNETERALDAYTKALEGYELLGEVDLIARARGNLARLYVSLDELESAETHLEAALPTWRRLKKRDQLALTLQRLGDLRKRQGRLDEAVTLVTEALELTRELERPRREASAQNSLGTALLERGDIEWARLAYSAARDLYRAEGDKRVRLAIHNLGRLHLPSRGRTGDPQKALDYFRSVTAAIGEGSDDQLKASNDYGIAAALAALGRPEEALSWLESTVDRVESVRTRTHSQGLRLAFFAGRQHYYDLMIELLMQLEDTRPGEGFAVRAFDVAERRRARGLLDMLGESAADIRRDADPALLAEEADVQSSLNALAARSRALGEESDPAPAAFAALEGEQRSAREALDDVRRRLRAESAGRLGGGEPLGVDQIRERLLGARTVLIAYSLGEARSFGWLVSRDGVVSFAIPEGREVIEARVVAAKTVLRERGGSSFVRSSRLRELGHLLLGPIAERLDGQRLVVVGDGALRELPFAALVRPSSEGAADEPGTPRYVVEDHEVVALPSASVLDGLRRQVARRMPADKQLAIVADPKLVPTGDQADEHPRSRDIVRTAAALGGERLPPLPGTRREAAAILDLAAGETLEALGAEATKARVIDSLGDYQIVHFATHGVLDRTQPELSGLVLALWDEDDRPLDGFLYLHEIYNLDLPAELVVLSACETGLGAAVAGEGLVGLTRGFMYAGAPRVLVSLWKVSDRGTAELMQRFYWAVLDQGASPSTALRAAQLSMLRDEDWSQPALWAAFVLEGEWLLPGAFDPDDDDIEGAYAGEDDDDEEDMDLPDPDRRCDSYEEAWQRAVCKALESMRRRR